MHSGLECSPELCFFLKYGINIDSPYYLIIALHYVKNCKIRLDSLTQQEPHLAASS